MPVHFADFAGFADSTDFACSDDFCGFADFADFNCILLFSIFRCFCNCFGGFG